MSNYKSRLRNIRCIIMDYDGVMTDGTVFIQPDGELLRTSNVKDGYAIQLAVRKGFCFAIITGGRSSSVKMRFEALGVSDVFLGVGNKHEVYLDYLKKCKLTPSEVLYMGDDIPDYKLMKESGVSACPADAAEEIKKIADHISHKRGGEGCAREIIEQLLKAQDKWLDEDAFEW